MTERNIISAGVKLVGLFLLLLGAIELSREGLSLIAQLLQADTKELPEGTWKLLSVVAFLKLDAAIVQVLLGIYLCRGGKWFVSMLSRDEIDS